MLAAVPVDMMQYEDDKVAFVLGFDTVSKSNGAGWKDFSEVDTTHTSDTNS